MLYIYIYIYIYTNSNNRRYNNENDVINNIITHTLTYIDILRFNTNIPTYSVSIQR